MSQQVNGLREPAEGDVVCGGRCPVCGRVVRLTWQRGGDVDRCPCGVEAVLVVVRHDYLQWYWRDPLCLPDPMFLHCALAPIVAPVWALGDAVQFRLV